TGSDPIAARLFSTNAAARLSSSAHAAQPKKCSSYCSRRSLGSSPRTYRSAAFNWIACRCSMYSVLPVVSPDPKSFHPASLLFRGPRPLSPALLIENAEVVLGAMQQHPQVVAIHAKFPTDLVFLLFFQEDSAQQASFLFGKLLQNLPHQKPIQIQHLVHGFRRIFIQLRAVIRRSVELLQHIVANRVNERPESLRLANSRFGTHCLEHPQKRFLRDILYRLRSPQARP